MGFTYIKSVCVNFTYVKFTHVKHNTILKLSPAVSHPFRLENSYIKTTSFVDHFYTSFTHDS